MKEVENEVDLVELQKEIDKRKVEDEKKKKSCYRAFDMVNSNLGSGISTKEGVALGQSTESYNLAYGAQENYPQAFNYQDYEGEFYTPMGLTVKIIPGSSAKDFKKWTKDAKAFNEKVEKYIVIGEGKYATHARIIYEDQSEFDMEKGSDDVSGIYGASIIEEKEIKKIKVTFHKKDETRYITYTTDMYSYSYSKEGNDITTKEVEELLEISR